MTTFMASLTVRQIDEALKQQLRLRAARHGRSVEDEVRTILREAAGDTETPAAPARRPRRPAEAPAAAEARSADHRRRHRRLQVARSDPAAEGARLAVRCILTKAARGIRHAACRPARITGERVFTDLFDPDHEFDVGHIRLAREADLIVVAPATADLMAKMANGHANDLATAVLLATTAKILLAPAMNPAHVVEQSDAAQSGAACCRRHRHSSARTAARWPSAANAASAAWPSRWRSPPRREDPEARRRAAAFEGQARPGYRRPDA